MKPIPAPQRGHIEELLTKQIQECERLGRILVGHGHDDGYEYVTAAVFRLVQTRDMVRAAV